MIREIPPGGRRGSIGVVRLLVVLVPLLDPVRVPDAEPEELPEDSASSVADAEASAVDEAADSSSVAEADWLAEADSDADCRCSCRPTRKLFKEASNFSGHGHALEGDMRKRTKREQNAKRPAALIVNVGLGL